MPEDFCEFSFYKYQATGNDFIFIPIVPQRGQNPESAWIQRLCDRHLGIGADGVVFYGVIQSVSGLEARFSVFNSDGSQAGTCGNALRCLAHLLLDRGFWRAHAGVWNPVVVYDFFHEPLARLLPPQENNFGVDLGAIQSLLKISLPETIFANTPWQDLFYNQVTFVQLANPHGVFVLKEGVSLTQTQCEMFGQWAQTTDILPILANIGILKARSEGQWDLRVYERGAGFTQACGSGAVAAALALGSFESYTFHLPGGPLRVQFVGTQPTLWGGAELVFVGRCRYKPEPHLNFILEK